MDESEKIEEKQEPEMKEEDNSKENSEMKKDQIPEQVESKKPEEEKINLIPENKEAKSSMEPLKEKKQGKFRAKLSGKGKDPSWKPLIFSMAFSILILGLWNSFPAIKNGVHAVLDPSAGTLLNWNLVIGMLILVLIISFFTNIAQKYCTDQDTLRELRKEQKILQEKSKEFQNHPEKMMEIQKEIMPLTSKTMKLSMRAVMFTGIPFILFFRWFNDFFTAMGNPKFFGFLSWFWFYLIFTMVFSSIFRKVLKVV